ncbi:hypothetical protein [Acinetobacter zhairhuonensis]|uniref:hypothetical protein n=1 Tax=Acinetobacter sp. A7.4 TaxID=2919921 RepID=UPI001F4F5733|nr:hypothetical protein [Acinetobacter sp. A7.4]MCJ8162336.1 hypothetical protein [Acinetobacter sp. A7.4]
MFCKALSILLLIFPTAVFAESKFDRSLIRAKIVNEKYEIIDIDGFNEISRQITNEVVSTLPRKVDIDTELLTMVVSRPLIAQTYALRGVETKKDLTEKMDLEKFSQLIKNYACSSAIGISQVYRVNGTQFSMKIINSDFLELYSYVFPLKTCDE